MKTISIEYVYTVSESVAACVEITRHVYRFVMLFFQFLGGMAYLTVAWQVFAYGESFGKMLSMFIFGSFMLGLPLITRISARLRAKKLPDINATLKWEITDSELSMRTDGAESRFQWNKLIKIVERKKGFLLFPQPRLAHWLPKHGFENPESIDTFREIIRQHEIPFKG